MLILKQNGESLYEVAAGAWFRLPDGSMCSPAQEGWDNGDGFTIESVADPVPVPPTLAEIRASASLPRLDFCLALLRLQILPVDECKAAARGEWPATFAGFVAGMAPADAAEAEIRWATAQNIFYGNALLQGLALTKAGGDPAAAAAFLDAIFGVSA